jgi:hypothetical protein
VIRYIAYGSGALAKNFNDFLKGKTLNLRRRALEEKLDMETDLLVAAGGDLSSKVGAYSILFKDISDYSGLTGIRIIDDTIAQKPQTLRAFNCTYLSLLYAAYKAEFPEFRAIVNPLNVNKRLSIEIKDPQKLIRPKAAVKSDLWQMENTLSYEARVSSDLDLFKFVQADLDKYFPYSARVEKRKRRCLVIVKCPSSAVTIVASARNGKPGIIRGKAGAVTINNIPFYPGVVNLLAPGFNDLAMPIIDGTNLTDKVHMQFTNIYDLDEVKKDLQRYGFDIIEQEKEIDCLIIRDK